MASRSLLSRCLPRTTGKPGTSKPILETINKVPQTHTSDTDIHDNKSRRKIIMICAKFFECLFFYQILVHYKQAYSTRSRSMNHLVDDDKVINSRQTTIKLCFKNVMLNTSSFYSADVHRRLLTNR